MTSKKNNDEIDLEFLAITIFENKLKIIFIVTICILFGFITYEDQKSDYKDNVIFTAKTKIKPISTFEEIKYETYNSYLKHNSTRNKVFSINDFKNSRNIEGPYILREFYNFKIIDYSSFTIINKKYLLSLFIDKFYDELILINGIKKFKLIKKENYKDNQEFENAVLKLVSNIKLNIIQKPNEDLPTLNITYQTTIEEKSLWNQVFKYFEENANLEIKDYIFKTFNKIIVNQHILTKYKIEDIEILKKNFNKNDMTYKELEKIKSYILNKKDIERLKGAFNTTPISNPDNFYAAKISLGKTQFTKIPFAKKKKIDKKTRLLLSGLMGFIISLIYIILENLIKRRK